METHELAEYRKKLRDAHFGEMVGERLFMKMRAKFPQKVASLQALSNVESMVGRALEELLDRYQVAPEESSGAAELTKRLLADIKTDDWRGWLHQFREVLRPFVQEFDCLYAHGPSSDSGPLRLLRDHERMLMEFVEQEIAGEDGLRVIEAFLRRVV